MRRNNPGADNLLGQVIPVLDKGSVCLVDYWGDDTSVVEAARVSYGKAADVHDVEGNRRLINYLMKHDHGSPFEQCGMAFNVKAPIFVFREWHRHRTASLNEISGRYAQLPDEYYIPAPERVQTQSATNKQGSGDQCSEDVTEDFRINVEATGMDAFAEYHLALTAGVSRELARIVLPLNTYSSMRWSCNLRNLLHFLRLRTAPNAQFEIRVFAEAIAEVVKAAYPLVYTAWVEHVQKAVTLSYSEVQCLRAAIEFLRGEGWTYKPEHWEAAKILTKLRKAA
jgi:thymidylate synthase (FAD)